MRKSGEQALNREVKIIDRNEEQRREEKIDR